MPTENPMVKEKLYCLVTLDRLTIPVARVGAEWRNGGMVEWQNGGMAEWRNGGMAEWRNGRMAEWRNGRVA
jgi:hypothetical protein